MGTILSIHGSHIGCVIWYPHIYFCLIISSAEAYGNDLMAILKNSPNALPWLFVLVFVLLSWKNEFLGGVIITLLGIAMLFFFHLADNFMTSNFMIALMVILIGNIFLLSWCFRK